MVYEKMKLTLEMSCIEVSIMTDQKFECMFILLRSLTSSVKLVLTLERFVVQSFGNDQPNLFNNVWA